MAKLADASALGADGVTLGGSSPLPPTIFSDRKISLKRSGPADEEDIALKASVNAMTAISKAFSRPVEDKESTKPNTGF